MDAGTLKGLLALSIHAARSPAELILNHWENPGLFVEHKGDGSPVTLADRDAESTIRTILQGNPHSADFDILGEEFGQAEQKTRYRWLIDPIDGTRSFINHIPLFGTILALEDSKSHKALIGVIHLPVLNVTYSAARGLGCFRNGVPVSVSKEASIETGIIATGDIAQFISAGCEGMFQRLTRVCHYLRGYTDCFGHALVIEGSIAAMLDPALNPWDSVATEVLIEEAGGIMVTRPSKVAGKIDALFGSPSIVYELVQVLNF